MHRFASLNTAGLALLAGFAVTVFGFAVPVFGQERHGFGVASVTRTARTDGRALLQATPGRLAMMNLAPRRLILIASDVQDYQLVGQPGWLDSESYDIRLSTHNSGGLEPFT
jgi:hypothetical protein